MKVNPEFIPLIEWWEKDGKQTVTYLVIAAIAVGGWYGWKSHRASVRQAASDALVSAYTTEEIEEAVSKFGGQATAGALKIRLAKSYYDAGKYQEAMATYEEMQKDPVEGFGDIPVVGKAQCLEALGRFAEAQKAFDAFVEANPTNYLTLTAKLGAARSLAEAGDKKAALARLAALKDAFKDDAVSNARVEATEGVINRLGKKAEVKPAPKVEEKKPEIKPAAKPAVKPAAKPEAKPAVKPATKPVAKPEAKPAAK